MTAPSLYEVLVRPLANGYGALAAGRCAAVDVVGESSGDRLPRDLDALAALRRCDAGGRRDGLRRHGHGGATRDRADRGLHDPTSGACGSERRCRPARRLSVPGAVVVQLAAATLTGLPNASAPLALKIWEPPTVRLALGGETVIVWSGAAATVSL